MAAKRSKINSIEPGKTMINTLLIVLLLTLGKPDASYAFWFDDEDADASTVETKAAVNPKAANKCILAEQLKDPLIRADYESYLEESRDGRIESNLPLDAISMECISCHDGVMAKGVNHRISSGNSYKVRGIEMIKGAHPVGMIYEKFGWNKEYVPAELLTAGVALIEGKVGCISCHNMLGKNEMYLAVDNSRSGLCFSCHNK